MPRRRPFRLPSATTTTHITTRHAGDMAIFSYAIPGLITIFITTTLISDDAGAEFRPAAHYGIVARARQPLSASCATIVEALDAYFGFDASRRRASARIAQ